MRSGRGGDPPESNEPEPERGDNVPVITESIQSMSERVREQSAIMPVIMESIQDMSASVSADMHGLRESMDRGFQSMSAMSANMDRSFQGMRESMDRIFQNMSEESRTLHALLGNLVSSLAAQVPPRQLTPLPAQQQPPIQPDVAPPGHSPHGEVQQTPLPNQTSQHSAHEAGAEPRHQGEGNARPVQTLQLTQPLEGQSFHGLGEIVIARAEQRRDLQQHTGGLTEQSLYWSADGNTTPLTFANLANPTFTPSFDPFSTPGLHRLQQSYEQTRQGQQEGVPLPSQQVRQLPTLQQMPQWQQPPGHQQPTVDHRTPPPAGHQLISGYQPPPVPQPPPTYQPPPGGYQQPPPPPHPSLITHQQQTPYHPPPHVNYHQWAPTEQDLNRLKLSTSVSGEVPRFQAVQGMVTQRDYLSKLGIFVQANRVRFDFDLPWGVRIILGGCTGTAERAFVKEHRNTLAKLSPSVSDILYNLQGVTDPEWQAFLDRQAAPGVLSTVAPFLREFQSSMHTEQVSSKGKQAVSTLLAQYADKPQQFHTAWHLLVRAALQVPLAQELAGWPLLTMGVPSTYHPDVNAIETPLQFAGRVADTFGQLTETNRDLETQLETPHTIFLKGIKDKHIQRLGYLEWERIDHAAVPKGTALLRVASILNNVYNTRSTEAYSSRITSIEDITTSHPTRHTRYGHTNVPRIAANLTGVSSQVRPPASQGHSPKPQSPVPLTPRPPGNPSRSADLSRTRTPSPSRTCYICGEDHLARDCIFSIDPRAKAFRDKQDQQRREQLLAFKSTLATQSPHSGMSSAHQEPPVDQTDTVIEEAPYDLLDHWEASYNPTANVTVLNFDAVPATLMSQPEPGQGHTAGIDSDWEEDDSGAPMVSTLLAGLNTLAAGIQALANQVEPRRSARTRGEQTYTTGKRFPSSFTPSPPTLHHPKVVPPVRTSQRPESFRVVRPAPPTVQAYMDQLSLKNDLRYAANPSSDLGQCISLLIPGDAGEDPIAHSNLRILIDDGSTAHLISEAACRKLGIPINPTTLQLSTSTSASSSVVGLTPALQLSYGTPPAGIMEYHYFIVTKGVEHLYDILLGNIETKKYMGSISTYPNSLNLLPDFPTLGLSSPTLSIPCRFLRPRRST